VKTADNWRETWACFEFLTAPGSFSLLIHIEQITNYIGVPKEMGELIVQYAIGTPNKQVIANLSETIHRLHKKVRNEALQKVEVKNAPQDLNLLNQDLTSQTPSSANAQTLLMPQDTYDSEKDRAREPPIQTPNHTSESASNSNQTTPFWQQQQQPQPFAELSDLREEEEAEDEKNHDTNETKFAKG